jgi:hypothetical protein
MLIKPFVCTLTIVSFSFTAIAQNFSDQKIFISDIDNFWIAYDSVRATTDSAKQVHFIQTLYVDKGTPGLKAFMKTRNYTPQLWVKLINRYPDFWQSVRPNTFTVKPMAEEIEKSIQQLKALYPHLKDAKMYFTIGGLNSGGTTMADMVLIGTEIVTANAETIAPNAWLADVFKEQKAGHIIPFNIHEYVHTQQEMATPANLLGAALREGACDYIAELVLGKPWGTNYLQYGRAHEATLKKEFKAAMYGTDFSDWLYNGNNAKTVADLGYFMGYAICKSYYEHAADKTRAIKEIIELRYSDAGAVDKFLKASRYYE